MLMALCHAWCKTQTRQCVSKQLIYPLCTTQPLPVQASLNLSGAEISGKGTTRYELPPVYLQPSCCSAGFNPSNYAHKLPKEIFSPVFLKMEEITSSIALPPLIRSFPLCCTCPFWSLLLLPVSLLLLFSHLSRSLLHFIFFCSSASQRRSTSCVCFQAVERNLA